MLADTRWVILSVVSGLSVLFSRVYLRSSDTHAYIYIYIYITRDNINEVIYRPPQIYNLNLGNRFSIIIVTEISKKTGLRFAFVFPGALMNKQWTTMIHYSVLKGTDVFIDTTDAKLSVIICADDNARNLQLHLDISAVFVIHFTKSHYSDVIMRAMASQITGVSILCSAFCSGAYKKKHQRSASLAFVRGIHRWPVDSPRKGPVTRKIFPFDDVIMGWKTSQLSMNSPNRQ